MFPLLADQGVASLPWCPLAKGRLARPYRQVTGRSTKDSIGARFFGLDDAVAALTVLLDGQLTTVQVSLPVSRLCRSAALVFLACATWARARSS